MQNMQQSFFKEKKDVKYSLLFFFFFYFKKELHQQQGRRLPTSADSLGLRHCIHRLGRVVWRLGGGRAHVAAIIPLCLPSLSSFSSSSSSYSSCHTVDFSVAHAFPPLYDSLNELYLGRKRVRER
jgi:hypothetical protein